MIFNKHGFPIGQILIPDRKEGRMMTSTHVAIRPGTKEAYICTTDSESGVAAIYRAGVYATAKK